MIRKEFKKVAVFAAVAAVALSSGMAWTADRVTAKEAEAMVKKAVVFIKTNGKAKGYAEITNKKGQFVDREFYISVYTMDGTMMAHGGNEKMVGRNFIELKDIDGKELVRERLDLVKTKPSFWQDYKWSNSVSKTIEAKSMYCERLEDNVVCGGIYRL